MSDALPSTRTSGHQIHRALRAERGLIAGCVVGSALLGLALNAWTTPVYRATTRLEIRRAIEPAPPGVGGFQSENVALYTTAELIKNRGLLDQLESDFSRRDWLDPAVWGDPVRSHLRALARAVPAGFGGDVLAPPATPPQDARAIADARVDWLRTIIRVEPVQDTRLVDIKVEHPIPEAARSIADRLAERFVAYAGARAGSHPATAPARVSQGGVEMPASLAAGEQEDASRVPLTDSVPVRSLARQLDVRMTNLTDELVRTEADAASIQARLARYARWNRDSLLDDRLAPVQSASLAALREQLVASRMRIASARQVYGARHPRMQALESELEVVQGGVDRELQRAVAEARAEEEALATRATSLRADLGRTREALAGCERRLQATQAVVSSEPARLPAEPVEIIDRATLPLEPIRPRRLLNLAACLSAGGLLGCGLAGVRQSSRRTIRSPEDAEEELGLPVLAVLPRAH